jgi:outer membrane lipoprotein-sorting protein
LAAVTRQRTLLVGAVALLLCGWPSLVGAYRGGDPAARDLLRQSVAAEQTTSYFAVKTFTTHAPDGRPCITEVRVWRLAPARQRVEYVAPPDRAGKILVENSEGAWIFVPHRNRYYPVDFTPPRENLRLLLRNYSVSQERGGIIAGRACYRVAVRPRVPGNPSKRVWLDRETFLPLRTELYSHSGQLRTIAAVKEIDYRRASTLSTALFAIPPGQREERRPPSDATPAPPFRPSYVPRGYILAAVEIVGRRPRGHHLRYTDGLNTVSLFVFDRARRRGRPPDPTPAYTRQVGRFHCVLMGDMPPTELQKMLDSLPESDAG